jgi:hypothetical protein
MGHRCGGKRAVVQTSGSTARHLYAGSVRLFNIFIRCMVKQSYQFFLKRQLSNTHTKMQIRTIRCDNIQNIHYINLLHSDISSSYTNRFAGIVLLAGSSKSGTSYITT